MAMSGYECLWDLDSDDDGNVQHISEHGLTKEDVEHAVQAASEERRSASSGLPLVFGPALRGEIIAVVFERIDETHIYPVTAYRPSPR